MKKIVVVLMIVALTFSLVGCGQESANDQGSAEEKIIKIGVLRIDDSLPFFVAEQEGLFEKHGVKVEVVPFGISRDQTMALEAEELDAIMTDMVVTAVLKNSGTDVKAVSVALGAEPKEGRFALLAAPNSDINSPEDLKNVPIAISNNTMIHFLVDEMTALSGLKPEEVATQSMPDLKLRLDALLEGKDVQAAILPDPLASLGELQGAKAIIDDTKLEVNLSQSAVIFRQDVIDQYPQQVQKVINAYNNAKTMLNENPDQYRDLLIETARVPEALTETYPSPTYTVNGLPTAEYVELVQQWMVEKGLVEKPFSYEELVDSQFVK